MPPKKSIFRQAGAQHFQLVHRSQRDPLINDPDAGQRVLKPVGRANDRKTYTLSELEESVDKSKLRPNEGEAALYGITYDDSSYDYMSHLRPLNAGGEGEVMLIAGPRGSGVAKGMKVDRKGKGKATDELFGLEGIQLPEGVLASRTERTDREVYASQAAIPEELQGLQPDMDPHLRQVLEALDDEAFVDSVEGEGDWFDELIGGGERGEDEGALADDFEFKEWGDEGAPQLIDNGEEGEWEDDNEDEDGQDETAETGEEGGETWMDRFKAFKEAGGHGPAGEEGDDDDANTADRSEMADTVGSLANRTDMMVLGGKKRRGKRGPSDATGMSMSSSSMFRNEGLRTLDERFDQIEREYELDDQYDDDDFPDDETASIAPSFTSNFSTSSRMSLMSHASAVPDVSREDFDAILDDFLENYEVVGRKYKQSLGGTALTGPEKLRVLRAAIDDEEDGLGKEESRRRILEIERIGRGVKGAKEIQERIRVDKDEEKWDVETILTTYTNTENHPAVIRSRSAAQAKAKAAKQMAEAATVPPPQAAPEKDEEDSGSETEMEDNQYRTTVARPKGESSEERKARKAAVKAERSARRAEKKSHTQTFGDERKKQLQHHKRMVGDGKAADLNVGAGIGANRRVVSLS